MSTHRQSVLCFPRSHIANCKRFTRWEIVQKILHAAEKQMTWLPRVEAEASNVLVQPIPCALVVNESRLYHAFRRINEGRTDLRRRISLVIGGHIDQDIGRGDFSSLATATLVRELNEELSIVHFSPHAKPIGLVIDHSSVESSRHVALVYEVAVAGRIKARAAEEFSMRSKYDGRPCSADELVGMRKEFDPWSLIVFGDYINPSYSQEVGIQLGLSH